MNDIEVSNTSENRERHFNLVVHDTRENTSLSKAWVMLMMTERLLSFFSSRRLSPHLFQRCGIRMGAEVGAGCKTKFAFNFFILELLGYSFNFFTSFVYLLFTRLLQIKSSPLNLLSLIENALCLYSLVVVIVIHASTWTKLQGCSPSEATPRHRPHAGHALTRKKS